MEHHRYQVGDKVEHRVQLTGGDRPLFWWITVEIVERCLANRHWWSAEPHYFVRGVGDTNPRFITDESYLRNKFGEVYSGGDEFVLRCRAIEPVEVIEGCVQPLSPWTEARVRAEMARDRRDYRRSLILAN